MRKYLAPLAFALAGPLLLVAAPATACESGPARPVDVRPTSLAERIERLVRQAAADEREADGLVQDAAKLSSRASSLRVAAQRTSGQSKIELLAAAAGLDRDAAEERAEAADLRLTASQLREEARQLRLAQTPRPPGWRGRVATF